MSRTDTLLELFCRPGKDGVADMGDKAKLDIDKRYSWDTITSQFESLYHRILSE